MSFHIKNVNKYYRWVKNHYLAYQDNRVISREYAHICACLNFSMLRNDRRNIQKYADLKNEYILNYIRSKCPQTIEKYKNTPIPSNLFEPNTEVKVWSMWWQGEENADKMFRMCIDSARRHTKHPVITLDKYNYKEYFDIPEFILKKHEDGKIAVQHICDLMFCSILAAQGGLFTGATVWWSQDATEELLKTPFYTPRAVDLNAWAMSKYRWTGYFMGGNKEFPLFSFARDCLIEYWQNADKAIEYVFMDYVFELAYQEIPAVKMMLDSLPEKNNLLRNQLIEKLSEPYDEDSFRQYTEGDTFIYKLSWKFGKKELVTEDGRPTNYAFMLGESGIGLEE